MRLTFTSLRFRLLLSALCSLTCAFTAANAQLPSRFAPTPSGFTLPGTSPQVIAETDVNGDGKLDLVISALSTASSTSPTISYLPGDGKGGFGKAIAMGTLPSNYTVLALGDFNHDDRLDLILFQPTTGRVLPMLGNTQHGFSAQTAFACSACGLGNTLAGATTGDFNKDGNLDLVLANAMSASLVTLLGNGNGTFRAPVVSSGFATAQFTMVAGDFNRDSLPDLVVSDGYQYMQTAIGNGDGSFRSGKRFTASTFMSTLLSVDLAGNGKLDLVVVPTGWADEGCAFGATLYVLPGNGDGTFGAEKDYFTGYLPLVATIADFNGDGKPDIATFNSLSNSFSILLNLGAGKLAPAASYKTNLTVYTLNGSIFGGDLNGDKRADLVIDAQDQATSITAQPGGTFHNAAAVESFLFPEILAPPVDLNHDGIPDLLAVGDDGSCRGNSILGILAPIVSSNGIPLNTLAQRSFSEINEILSLGIGDFNSDGNLDPVLISESFSTNSLEVFFNDAHGNLTPVGNDSTFPTTNATNLAVGDFNGDGKSDLALADGGEIQIRLGTGGQNFKAPVSYSAAGQPVAIAVRDLNGDGKKDLVAVNQANDSISVLLGRGDGTFDAAKSYSVADGPFQVAFADFNRDGKIDLVVADTNQVSILLGKGDGTFLAAHNYAAATPLVSLATADLRGMGNFDVLAGAKSGDILMFPGAGNGTLGTAQHYAAHGANVLQVADFNRDSAQDIITSGPDGTAMSLLYNQGGTHVALVTSAATITLGHAVTLTVNIGASVPNSGTPAGTVTFKDGTKTIATTQIANGKATFTTSTLAKGSHSVSASYNGNSSFNPHATNTVTVTVQ